MSLLHWWQLNNSLEDSGLNGITLINSNVTFPINSGKVTNSCAYFDSDNDFLRIDGLTELTQLTEYSMSCWVYLNSVATNHSTSFLSSGNWNTSSAQVCFGAYSYNSGYQVLLVPNKSSWSAGISLAAEDKILLNKWYQITITYDGTTTKGYINGKYIGSYNGGGISATEVAYYYLGAATYYSGFTLHGKLNDFRIYNHALSVKEVKEIAKGLCIHYKFNFEDLYQPTLYLRGTGNQYINTNVIPTAKTNIEINFNLHSVSTSNTWVPIYGVRGASSAQYFNLFVNSGSTHYISPNYAGFDPGTTANTTIAYDTTYNFKTNGGQLYINGTLNSAVSTTNTLTTTGVPFYLWCIGTTSGVDNRNADMDIYSFKVWEDGVIIRDMIPCIRKCDTKPGMYDLVNNVFYTNAGSGEFITPYLTSTGAQYKIIDYIEFTGAQRFYLGSFVPKTNTHTKLYITPNSSYVSENSVFGTEWSAVGYFLMFYNGKIRFHSRNYVCDVSEYSLSSKLCIETFSKAMTNSLLKINGTPYSYTSTAGAETADSTSSTMCLGAVGSNQSLYGHFKFHKLEIYEGDTLVANYMPCVSDKGKIGLFETVNGSFINPVITTALKDNPIPSIGHDPTTEKGNGYNYSSVQSFNENNRTVIFSKSSEGWGNAGILGKVSFNTGTVRATVGQNNKYIMIGVAPVNNSYNYTQGYFIYPAADGKVYCYELGSSIGVLANSYSANDIFKVEYDGSSVRYYWNDVSLRVRTGVSGPMYLNITTYSTSSIIKDVSCVSWDEVLKDPLVPDNSGFGHNGTLSSSVTTTSDTPIGSSSAYLNNVWCIAKSGPDGMQQMSTFMWEKQPSPNTQRFLFGTFNSWTGNGIGWWVDSGGTSLSNLFRVNEMGSYSGATAFTEACDGNWHHIGITWDGTTYRTYKDGQKIGEVTPSTGGTIMCPVWYFGGALYNNEKMQGYLADARVYATALSDADVLELYNTRENIDNKGNLYCTTTSSDEILNDTSPAFDKKGIVKVSNIAEQITLDDGSTWQLICVHSVPEGLFPQSGTFSTLQFTSNNRWCNFGLINTVNRPESGWYEFLVMHQTAVGRAYEQYRWKQNKNPFNAVWSDVNPSAVGTNVIRISATTTNSYAGMYWYNAANCKMCFANTSNGNWFGCGIGAYWGTGYIPSYNGKQCYGNQLVYIRVKNKNLNMSKSGIIMPTEIKEI